MIRIQGKSRTKVKMTPERQARYWLDNYVNKGEQNEKPLNKKHSAIRGKRCPSLDGKMPGPSEDGIEGNMES